MPYLAIRTDMGSLELLSRALMRLQHEGGAAEEDKLWREDDHGW